MIIGSKIERVRRQSTQDLADVDFKGCFEMRIRCPVTGRRATLFVVAIMPDDDRDATETVELILEASGADKSLADGIVRDIRRKGDDKGSIEVPTN